MDRVFTPSCIVRCKILSTILKVAINHRYFNRKQYRYLHLQPKNFIRVLSRVETLYLYSMDLTQVLLSENLIEGVTYVEYGQ